MSRPLTRTASWVVAALLVAGCALTGTGLTRLTWPNCISFTIDGLPRLVLFTAVSFGALLVLNKLRRISTWEGAAALTFVIALAGGALWSIVWVAICTLSIMLTGDLLMRGLRWVPTDRLAHALLSLSIGMVLLGAVVELTAGVPVHSPLTYGLAIAIPLIACHRRLIDVVRSTTGRRMHSPPRTYLLDCAIATIGIVYATSSLFPELGFDSMVFHLAVPHDMAQHGRWHFDVTQMALAVMPKHADWLYSVGFMLGGETGARMANAGLILAAASAAYWLTSRFATRHQHACGLIASGLFLSMPLTYAEGSILFVESLWAFLVLSTLVVWLDGRSSAAAPGAAFIAIGLMCGAVATKPQGLLSSAVLAALLAPWLIRGLRHMRLTHIMWTLVLIACVAVAPYARAWAFTGNPVFPFFNAIFKSNLFAHVNFKDAWQTSVDWTLPYAITFDSSRFMEAQPGSVGFQWLLLLPAAAIAVVAGRSRVGVALLVAGTLLFAAVFTGSKYLRYVFPAFAMLVPVIGIGLSMMSPALFRIAWCLSLTCMALNCLFLTAAGYKYSDFPLSILGDPAARASYVQADLPVRTAIEVINAVDRDARPVAFFCQPAGAGLRAKPLYASWYNGSFDQAVRSATCASDMGRLLCEQDVDYVILDRDWGTPSQRSMVTEVSEPVTEIGRVQVRRVRGELYLTDEMLKEPDFKGAGWSSPNTLERCPTSGGILVSQSSPATQLIECRPRSEFTLSVDAVGIGGTVPCRAQVNWLDADGRIVRADIETFEATTAITQHVMRKCAPASAVSGMVYATAHTDNPVCVVRVSLKWRIRFGDAYSVGMGIP